jgi:acetyl-CoA acetyltransferase
MMLSTVQGAIKEANLTKDDIGFTVSGSCDYLSGRGFSFVANVDAYGAYPPINESHVEMDGSFAMYEAFVRLLQGDIDTAVAAGVGKNSNSDPETLYTIEMDPYYLTPLGADPWSLAALQYRALLDAGKITERQVAEVVVRNRASAKDNANAQVSGDFDVDELLSADYVRDPLRRHDLPPITDGCAAVVLARGKRAYDLCERPVWITGIDHRIEPHLPTMRADITASPSTRLAAEGAGAGNGPIEVAELHAPFSFQELVLTEALGLGGDTAVNPSGGALAANPVMVTGLLRVIEAARQIAENGKHRTLAHTTSGPCLQQNLVCILEGDE